MYKKRKSYNKKKGYRKSNYKKSKGKSRISKFYTVPRGGIRL